MSDTPTHRVLLPLQTGEGVVRAGTLLNASGWVNLIPLEDGGYIVRLKPAELEALSAEKPAKKEAVAVPVDEVVEEIVDGEPLEEKPAKKAPAKKQGAVKKSPNK